MTFFALKAGFFTVRHVNFKGDKEMFSRKILMKLSNNSNLTLVSSF